MNHVLYLCKFHCIYHVVHKGVLYSTLEGTFISLVKFTKVFYPDRLTCDLPVLNTDIKVLYIITLLSLDANKIIISFIKSFFVEGFGSRSSRIISLSPFIVIDRDVNPLTIADDIISQHDNYVNTYGEDLFDIQFGIKYSYKGKQTYLRTKKGSSRSYSTYVKNKDLTYFKDQELNINGDSFIKNVQFYEYDCNKWPSQIKDGTNSYIFKRNPSLSCIVKIEGMTSTKSIYNNEGVLLKSFKDIKISEDLFTRIIDNKELTILNNIVIRSSYQTKSTYLSKLKPVQFSSLDMINTQDIECIIKDTEFIPYAVGYYNGNDFTCFYGSNCVNDAVKYLTTLKGNRFIYIHNQDKFDFKFLLIPIINSGVDLHIIPGKGLLGITGFSISYAQPNMKKQNTITFIDSLKVLSDSLASLTKSFNLKETKGDFPYQFMDSFEKLDYVGEWPDQSYFKNPIGSKADLNNVWNAYNETYTYLKSDCVLQYEVIKIFMSEICSEYNIKAVGKLSLPSIVQTVYRTKFLDEKINIANLNPNIDSFIRNGYYGGIVDVYKPVLNNGYYYDINSLYPYAKTFDMPIGAPRIVYGETEISKIFGFLTVEVEAPTDMDIPFLPCKYNNRLLNPLGKWTGVYFSKELEYAKTLGYKFKIIGECYDFDRGRPFDSYINHFYEIKKTSTDPIQRKIAKFMLNSLYGKFGKSRKNNNIEILDTDSFIKTVMESNLKVYEILQLDNGKGLYNVVKDINRTQFTNVAIAASITAYSRIEIDQYKRISNNQCFYSDTDSVFLQYPLDGKYIGSDLGQMKLEDQIAKAVFISPKVYGYKTSNKTVIKIKGFDSDKVSFMDLESLLFKEAQIQYVNKIFKKDVTKVFILDQTKILQSTIENKRVPIYDSNGMVVNTKPIILDGSDIQTNIKLPFKEHNSQT